ncbi:MAG: ZIP family metal transporter [Candidatus Omnitrophica bacterium]|nr:ZIP family metal transporter [Candidatus Omnitrophota bacterium]
MTNYIWAIGASIFVSLVSLIGIFSLFFKENLLEKILIPLIAFSAGGLIGGAFLHIMPEAIRDYGDKNVFLYLIVGFIVFFILEKYLHWRHCHKGGECKTHPFTYLNLFGDAIHNFTDGLAIGASFVIGIHFGLITTFVIILHEIPHEIGNFGVLVYGGFSRVKALIFNFITALTCILGASAGFLLSEKIKSFSMYLLPIIAGGFVYIAACDLIPEIHKGDNNTNSRSLISVFAFLFGIIFILIFKDIFSH